MSYRRGIVRELDPKGVRARVEFEEHDGVVSWWLSVNMPHASAGKNRVYAMPDIGAQVNCLVDARAEEGTILGAIYSDVDTPPVTDANHMHAALEGGLICDYDRATGTLVIKAPGGITLDVNGEKLVIAPGRSRMHTADFEFVT